LNTEAPLATLPVAWLRRLPDGYVIPIWRWVLFPATTIMLKRYGGMWMSGELKLMGSHIAFTQSRLVKSSRTPPAHWEIPLDSIADITVQKGLTSETIEVRHAGQTTKLMTARSAEFVELLNKARATPSP